MGIDAAHDAGEQEAKSERDTIVREPNAAYVNCVGFPIQSGRKNMRTAKKQKNWQ